MLRELDIPGTRKVNNKAGVPFYQGVNDVLNTENVQRAGYSRNKEGQQPCWGAFYQGVDDVLNLFCYHYCRKNDTYTTSCL